LLSSLAQAQQQVKPRFVVIVDTSGSMVLTPEFANVNGNDGVPTHGDGTNENPGCNIDGDVDPYTGYAFNDSRLYVAKAALTSVVGAFGEVEFALMRFRQIEGTACNSANDCPRGDGPGGTNTVNPFTCANNKCVVDPGACSPFNYDECVSTFDCNNNGVCSSNGARNTCNNYKNDDTCQGDPVPFGTGTVSCANAMSDQTGSGAAGAYTTMGSSTCYNDNGVADGQVLVTFPATALDDNYAQIVDWIDHDTTDGKEMRAMGLTPLGGAVKSARTFLLSGYDGFPAVKPNDTAACRSYNVILITDGIESCGGNAATEAATLLTSGVKTYVIALSLCPSGTPNCSAKQTLDAIAAAGGTTAAYAASSQTDLALALSQIVQASIKGELCDGMDNDCDTLIDEDYPDLGQTCSAGIGECKRTGTRVCRMDQQGTQCSVTAGMPGVETCNGKDDDCNGLVDDGIVCMPCTVQPEVCNNKDDDCDGLVDDGVPSVTCGTNTGECTTGLTQCLAGGVIDCVGDISPVPEICNNKDDDCDGFVDGFSSLCYEFPSGCTLATQSCQGTCQIGVKTCTAGAFGACLGDIGPVTEIPCNGLDDDCDGMVDETTGGEVCNGLDDDCDGMIDEGTLGAPIGESCGTPPFIPPCKAGTVQCVAGTPTCVGELNPLPEACDGVDNDCNGVVDNGDPGGGASCGDGTGACAPGTLHCVGGGLQCQGEIGPAPEVCNCLDDDCDTFTDENDPLLGTPCMNLPSGGVLTTEAGECQFGIRTCSATTCGLVCTGIIGPVPETCDGRDNDCDNQTDEDFPLGAPCDNGMQGACKFGGVTVCAPNGMGTVCNAPPGTPGVEVCNGIDDDCDGLIDEDPLPLVGQDCGPMIGQCQPPKWSCQNGQLVCSGGTMGGVEVCNGVDDDCDQQIDEPPLPDPWIGEDCTDPGFEQIGDTGECEFGQLICENGAPACDGYKGPSPEICNGKDDDCDGVADEMAMCPDATNLCVEGSCLVPCGSGEFPCPAGFYCKNLPSQGNFCLADPCFGVTCPPGNECDQATGQCVDLCTVIQCPAGKTCVQGACSDCFDPRLSCMEGFVCHKNGTGVGECVADPCPAGKCPLDQICNNGACVSDCTDRCQVGERCDLGTGTCVDDPCAEVACAAGQICDPEDGTCKDDRCKVVTCKAGEVCVPETGDCIGDPCAAVDCPEDTRCIVDVSGAPQCQSKDYVPPARVDEVLATSGGGCHCEVGQAQGGRGRGLGFGGLVVLGLALLLRRRRGGGER
jgi:MYXO-CTERM domain-containing protein